MKKKYLFIGIIAILILIVGCVPTQRNEPSQSGIKEVSNAPPNPSESTTSNKEGRVVFTIADAAANMGAVSKVIVTINSVSVHSSTEGWTTVSSTPQSIDLLTLKAEGAQKLLADVKLKEGDYQQLRLDISKVIVTDASGDHEAKLPSGELKMVGGFTVNTNSTSTATFDFVVDESLHITGNGEYILAPVVQLETKENADVEVDADKKVKIKAGNTKTKAKVGMDIKGNFGEGLKIGKDEDLEIEGSVIKLKAKTIGSSKVSESSNAPDNSNKPQMKENTTAKVSVKVGGY